MSDSISPFQPCPSVPAGLRPFAGDDFSRLREFAEPIWEEAYRDLITSAQIRYMMDRGYAPDVVRREIEKDGVEYFWIEEGDSPGSKAGFLACERPAPDSEAFLSKFYLRAEFRGSGIARRAMEALVARHVRAGSRAIRLRVNRGNERAIRFYQARGFEIAGEDCLDIGGGFVMDDYLMRLSFAP